MEMHSPEKSVFFLFFHFDNFVGKSKLGLFYICRRACYLKENVKYFKNISFIILMMIIQYSICKFFLP